MKSILTKDSLDLLIKTMNKENLNNDKEINVYINDLSIISEQL